MFNKTSTSKLFLFSMAVILVFSAIPALAQNSPSLTDEEVNIYFFWAHGCPHCNHEKPFLEKLEQKYSNLKVHSFEVTGDKENVDLLKKIGKELSADVSGVPFTVVGRQYFVGWYDEQTTGAAIEQAVQCVLQNSCPDVVGSLITPITPNPKPQEKRVMPEKIKLPILGEIETKKFSLPLLTILIAGLDGFNPCAMWVLLFLITLLLGMKDKKRMWVLGTAFIVSSAFVYFLFMSAWLNLFLFLGFVLWVRIIIGLVALVAGGYNLKEYFTNKAGTCKITGNGKKQRIFEKLKAITQKKQFWIALGGIVILAFAVNLVELICSAGLPAIYTQILTLTPLAKWQYYAYLLLYIFIFMLDDLFVFFVAMTTLQMTGITTKYSHISHLVGGIIMLIIGLLIIFRPEWLMFG
ncbi:MAG: thioredoxin family protein [Minisyncoccales bacterium]